MYREPTLQGFVSEATPNANPSGRPAPTCHSGEVAPATGAQESRRSNQNSFTSKSGSAQTQSGSTPSEGYSREAWIPGPLPKNDANDDTLLNRRGFRVSFRCHRCPCVVLLQPHPRNDPGPGSVSSKTETMKGQGITALTL